MFLAEYLACHWAFVAVFVRASAVVHFTVRENFNEFERQLMITLLAEAVVANDKVGLSQFDGFFFDVEGLHVGEMTTYTGVLFNSQFVIKHLGQVLCQVVAIRADLPVVWDVLKHLVCLQLVGIAVLP